MKFNLALTILAPIIFT